MKTGSFFSIGTTHTVCEDYALHGDNYVILSDGCSNGGKRIHTDWGSRLLCKAAEQHLNLLPDDPEAFNNRCITTALTQQMSIPYLPHECLTATLLVAVAKGDKIFVHMVGDGVFGAKFKDGTFIINEFNFGEAGSPSNAPYYLRYELDKADREMYLDKFGNKATHSIYTGDIHEASTMNTITEIEHNILERPFFYNKYDPAFCDFVFIASDGVGSFYEPTITGTTKQNVRISVPSVLEVLLDFKNFGDGFVERQAHWTLKTNRPGSFGKLDWHNGDDVSLGVIHCGD